MTISRCYKNVYSFFPRVAKLWNSVPIECFPLTYDLGGFSVSCNLFCVSFLVTPCFVVAVQTARNNLVLVKKQKTEILLKSILKWSACSCVSLVDYMI